MGQRTIRYGIIGFGRFAEKTIAPAIRNAEDSALIALQKRSAGAARVKADEHAVPLAFGSVDELVRHPDVDAVFIVSANATHCAETIAAAEAGKHVIVEKPMAMNAAEGEKMIEACRKNNVRLMVAHMVRLSPLVRRIKSLVTSGQLGTITAVKAEFIYDARLSHRTWLLDRLIAGGGPVFDVGVHCLDTLRYILDDEPIDVTSALSPLPTATSTEESAVLSLRFSRGTIGSIFCSYTSPIRRAYIEIVGSDRIASAHDFTVANQVARLTVIQGKADRPSSTTIEEIHVPNLYIDEISMFTRWVLGGPEPEINGANGLANQRVIDRALEVRSAR